MSLLPFPQRVLDQHAFVSGKTGAGKSSAMRVVVEHLLDNHKRVCVIDPKGDWYGLKAGYPVITFGDFKGDYEADVPLNKESGKHVAELITSGNRPAIIGFRGWFTSHMTEFWIDFAKTLFHENEGELYLVIDEAQNFAPKGSLHGLEGKAGTGLHWTNRLLAEGRGLGINIWVGSQRPQKVHNDTLDGCETLVAMRTVHPAARNALAEWMKGSGDKEATGKILSNLAEIQRGEAWIWSPEIGFGPKLTSFPMFTTFDSFAPPQLQKKVAQKTWADVDLEAVKEKLASVIKEAEARDPAKLRAKIAALEKDRREMMAHLEKYGSQKLEIGRETVKVPILDPEQAADLRAAVIGLRGVAEGIGKDVEALERAIVEAKKIVGAGSSVGRADAGSRTDHVLPAERKVASSSLAPHSRDGETAVIGGLTRKQQQILDALAFLESIGNESPSNLQVGAIALIDATGGHFSNVVGPLSSNGLIIRESGRMRLTEQGRQVAHVPAEVGSLEAYHEVLRNRVRKVKSAGGKTIDILNVVISRGPDGEVSNEEIGAEAHIDHTGGHFSNMIGPLSTLGLIRRDRGIVRATDVLFPPGLS